MATVTKLVFTNIFLTEPFSAVKFAMGYENNMSFLVIPKSQKKKKKKKKKVETIGLGCFKKRFLEHNSSRGEGGTPC